jgi:glutathione S-transferase
MRARMALASSGQACALREVVLRDKPQPMLDASPKGTVPVLVLQSGEVIDESLDVMVWALGQSDPDHWLAPLKADEDTVRALIAENDGPFKAHLDRYKYPTRYDGVDPLEQRAGGLKFLEKLDARLANQPFLFGDQLTIADAAIAPFVRQFANTDRTWFDALPIPHLQGWLARILSSQEFLRVMNKYTVWKAGDEEPVFLPN